MSVHHQFFEDIKKFPNLLCLYRLFAIIACCLLFVCGGLPITATLIGLTAGLSDYFDGYYARRHNMVTRLGALLDGVSDLMFNFFVIGAAVYMEVWPLAILYLWGFRDLSVLTMRATAAQLGFDIPSSYLGKLASNFIFYGLFLMPIDYALNSPDYIFADFVRENIPAYVGPAMHWFAMVCGAGIGIVMQWISAIGYAKVFIQKYDEYHKAENEKILAEAETLEGPTARTDAPSA